MIDLSKFGKELQLLKLASGYSAGTSGNNRADYARYKHEGFGEASSSVDVRHFEGLTSFKRTVALTPELHHTDLYNQRFNPPYRHAVLATPDRWEAPPQVLTFVYEQTLSAASSCLGTLIDIRTETQWCAPNESR